LLLIVFHSKFIPGMNNFISEFALRLAAGVSGQAKRRYTDKKRH
jgi:hypothetical protein